MSDNVKTRWYKDAVIYQIYPRSFCDSNGDGIGDLRGVISKLDYLKELGVDAVWMSPCYKSPNDDNGYDISDYRDIMDEFGTLDDFKEMIAGMHERGIKLVMDLVSNHSSDEHQWFKESRKSKDNPYRDYYYWRDKPNNWKSNFLGPAWKYDNEAGQYYLHLFSEKQPDLNWGNPKVRQEIIDICNYWFEMGVDGFRCDVISYISKAPGLPDGFPLNPQTGSENYILGPDFKKYIKEIDEKSWDRYDSMIVGEAIGINYKNAPEYLSEKVEGLDTAFSFEHMYCDLPAMILNRPFPLPAFKKIMSNWQQLPLDCQPTLYVENHDQPRCLPRFTGDYGSKRKEASKMICIAMMMQRGTPYIYEGQEIGMTSCPFNESDYVDIMSLNSIKTASKIPFFKDTFLKIWNRRARDNARTPMQWSAEKNAGFTTGNPWMKINPNYTQINVEEALGDPDSILHFYQKVMKFRKGNKVIISGGYRLYLPKDKDLFMYERYTDDKRYLVICNFKNKIVNLYLPDNLYFRDSKLVLSNYPDSKPHVIDGAVREYEALVYEIK